MDSPSIVDERTKLERRGRRIRVGSRGDSAAILRDAGYVPRRRVAAAPRPRRGTFTVVERPARVLRYKQQADLLLELAQIDATLDEIDDRRARNRHDAELYADERGGDVRRMLVCPLRGLYDEASSSEEEEAAEGDGEARAAAAARAAARQAGRETVAEAARGYVGPAAIDPAVGSDEVAKRYAAKQARRAFRDASAARRAKERERATRANVETRSRRRRGDADMPVETSPRRRRGL